MTQTLILYWQRLIHHRAADDVQRAEAPVLDLAACFGNPVIAAEQARNAVIRLSAAAGALPEPR